MTPTQDDPAPDMLHEPHPDVFDRIMWHLVFAAAASLTVLVLLWAAPPVLPRAAISRRTRA